MRLFDGEGDWQNLQSFIKVIPFADHISLCVSTTEIICLLLEVWGNYITVDIFAIIFSRTFYVSMYEDIKKDSLKVWESGISFSKAFRVLSQMYLASSSA